MSAVLSPAQPQPQPQPQPKQQPRRHLPTRAGRLGEAWTALTRRSATRQSLTRRLPLTPRLPLAVVLPTVVAAVNAVAFFVVRPNVGDLQAALARQFAAANGVGLAYWFQWFGGGATPGNYSVVVPSLSALVGAPLIGVLATVAVTPLAYLALAGTPHRTAGTWVATYAFAWNIWSGRIPFAMGCAVGVLAIIAVRWRHGVLAALALLAASLCSPVVGAFVGFGLGAALLVERAERRRLCWLTAAVLAILVAIAAVFGAPGPQPYPALSAVFTAVAALGMLLARPARPVRSLLWCIAIAVPLLALVPNGLGSNFVRLPWIILPAAVVATATASRRRIVAAASTAVVLCANATVIDLVHARVPSASATYYTSLISQLRRMPDLRDHRLEVVQSPTVHTAAFALLGHAALAGGYETQEQQQLNGILLDRARLNRVSYKVWLDNSAVGYVALNRRAGVTGDPEYDLVRRHLPSYLRLVSASRTWALYRVADAVPIVAAPQRLVNATQAALVIRVPCACSFPVRVRYSKFLAAASVVAATGSTKAATGKPVPAVLRDDGFGWTVMTTTAPGRYVLTGDLLGPLH